MSKNKSDILKKLSINFPNFLKKDLSKVIEIILENIKNSLKNNERVELRDTIIFEAKSFKERYARDQEIIRKYLFQKENWLNSKFQRNGKK